MNWFDSLQKVLQDQNVVDRLLSIMDVRFGRNDNELSVNNSVLTFCTGWGKPYICEKLVHILEISETYTTKLLLY